ncbi:MAG TPA: PAS domain S-box protein [Chloroflexi bacterium]|nr:PAS domain S-box protein [Chloroflexota bacterium]
MSSEQLSQTTMADLAPGSHLCCFYQTEEEHRAILTPFVQRGLVQGEKVIYIVDERTADTVLGYLRDVSLPVEDYVNSGQLVLLTSDETYLQHGTFNPDAMIHLLQIKVDRAISEGYPLLRVTGEMTWVLRGPPGSQRLIEYEVGLNKFLPHAQCVALCQYDQRRFDPDLLLDVLYTHPTVAIGTEILDNYYYTPPDVFLNGERSATKWHYLVESLIQRQRTEEAYRTLVEHSLQGLVMIQENQIVFANEKVAQMVGYTWEALLTFSAGDLRSVVHPKNGARIWQNLQDRLQGKPIPPRQQFRFIHRDGSVRWVETLASYTEYRGKAAIQIAFLDITERKRAESALRESEARLRTLIESAEDIVSLHDFDGRYLYYHGPSRYGIQAADVLGRTPVDLFGEEEASPIIEQTQAVMRRGES